MYSEEIPYLSAMNRQAFVQTIKKGTYASEFLDEP